MVPLGQNPGPARLTAQAAQREVRTGVSGVPFGPSRTPAAQPWAPSLALACPPPGRAAGRRAPAHGPKLSFPQLKGAEFPHHPTHQTASLCSGDGAQAVSSHREVGSKYMAHPLVGTPASHGGLEMDFAPLCVYLLSFLTRTHMPTK